MQESDQEWICGCANLTMCQCADEVSEGGCQSALIRGWFFSTTIDLSSIPVIAFLKEFQKHIGRLTLALEFHQLLKNNFVFFIKL
jgi:hypothetical protein